MGRQIAEHRQEDAAQGAFCAGHGGVQPAQAFGVGQPLLLGFTEGFARVLGRLRRLSGFLREGSHGGDDGRTHGSGGSRGHGKPLGRTSGDGTEALGHGSGRGRDSLGRRDRSRADGLGGRPGGVQADLCHLSGGTHHVQSFAQNRNMMSGGLDFCGRVLDFAPERFQGASERFGRTGGLLGDGSVGTGRLIGCLLRRRFLSGGLLGSFQSIGIFFCGLGGFLLSNYSLIQGLLCFIRCSSVFPKGRLQMLIALT